MFIFKAFKNLNKKYHSISTGDTSIEDVSVIDFGEINNHISDLINPILYIDHKNNKTIAYLASTQEINSPLIKRPCLNGAKKDITVEIPRIQYLIEWISLSEDIINGPFANISIYNIYKLINEYNPYVVYINIPSLNTEKLVKYKTNLERHKKNTEIKYLELNHKSQFNYEINTVKCSLLLSHNKVPDIVISLTDEILNIFINNRPDSIVCSLQINLNEYINFIKNNSNKNVNENCNTVISLIKDEMSKIIPLIPNIFIEKHNNYSICCLNNSYTISKILNLESYCSLEGLNEQFDKYNSNYNDSNLNYKELINLSIHRELFRNLSIRLNNPAGVIFSNKLHKYLEDYHSPLITGHYLKKYINFDFNKSLC